MGHISVINQISVVNCNKESDSIFDIRLIKAFKPRYSSFPFSLTSDKADKKA